MKVIYSVFFALLFCSGYAQSETITFGGVVKNPTGDTLYITAKNFKKALVPNAQGFFKETFSIKKGLYDLNYGDEETGLYLKGGYDLTVDVDAKNFSETLTFTGNGNPDNNFLAMAGRNIDMSDSQALGKMTKLYMTTDKDFQKTLQKDDEENKKQAAERKEQRKALKQLNGKVSADFAYKDINGKVIKLSNFKGKYVYIDVWATWCGPCKMEIPHIQKAEQKFKGENIEFISISVDKNKDIEKWKKMVEDQTLGGIQLVADKDWESDFIKAYGINSIPRFILIGPDGKIIDADAKRPSDPALQEQLGALLK